MNQKTAADSKIGLMLALMAPFAMHILNMQMFRVALPSIRSAFELSADITAWLVTAHDLPFMIFLPLYGLLGDRLGKRRLFIIGVSIFAFGTVLIMLTDSVALLVAGRIVQGTGTAGFSALCIAVISDVFSPSERGRALARWNSSGTLGGLIGPITAGFLIDRFGWRMIYAPVLLAFLVAMVFIVKKVPRNAPKEERPPVLEDFDWIGMILMALTFASLVFFVSSRPLTGIRPLQDWRLGLAALICLSAFVMWELRRRSRILDLSLLRSGTLGIGAVCAAIRMFTVSSLGVLIPLYLTDIHGLSAAAIGGVLTIQFVTLFLSMLLGGRLVDFYRSRWIMVLGPAIQCGALAYWALLSGDVPVWCFIAGLVVLPIGSGLYLAPAHHVAMATVPRERSGAGAGLYSSIRYTGSLLGPAMAGALLQSGSDGGIISLVVYQRVFWILLAVTLSAVLIATRIRN